MAKLTEEQLASLQEKVQKIQSMKPEEQQKAIKEMLTKEEVEYLQEQQCIFCRIAKGEVPTKKVYEDTEFIAFLDINPLSPGHTQVIPKEHFSVLPQIPDELNAKYFEVVKKLSSAIYDAMNAQGINILQGSGQAAGQVVMHASMQIIPRFEDDRVDLTKWNAKKMPDEQLTEIQKRIVEKAGKVSIGNKKKVVYDMKGNVVEENGKRIEKKEEKSDIIKIKRRKP